MNKSKIIIIGITTALCLIAMLDMGYGNGSISKLLSNTFFTIIIFPFAIPVLMIQSLGFIGYIILGIIGSYWLALTGFAFARYYYRAK